MGTDYYAMVYGWYYRFPVNGGRNAVIKLYGGKEYEKETATYCWLQGSHHNH